MIVSATAFAKVAVPPGFLWFIAVTLTPTVSASGVDVA